jgi:hypothetical protein
MDMSESLSLDKNEQPKSSERLIIPEAETLFIAESSLVEVRDLYSDLRSLYESIGAENLSSIGSQFVRAEKLAIRISDLVDELQKSEGVAVPETYLNELVAEVKQRRDELRSLHESVTAAIVAMGFVETTGERSGNEEKSPDTSGQADEPAEPNAVGSETQPVKEVFERDLLELYQRWQNGDPTLFRAGWWHQFDTIARDVSVFLKAAGYAEAAVDLIGKELLKPWMDKVSDKRRHGNKSVRWNHLSDEILHSIRDLLAGKEPDRAVLEGEGAVSAETTTKSAEDTEVSVSPDTIPDVDGVLVEEQFRFQTLQEKLSRHPALEADLAQGKAILNALTGIVETDAVIKLRMKEKYLKVLRGLNERLQQELSQQTDDEPTYRNLVEGDAVFATVPANLPVVSSESAPINPKPEMTYAEVNHERAAARIEFTKARDVYYEALHDHYRKLGVRTKNVLGMNIELPPEIQALKAEHDAKQKEYAMALDATLAARAEKGLAKEEYQSLESDKTKAAFADRFVVQSAEATEAAKLEVGDTSEFVKRAQAMAKFMRDHKGLVRILTVAGYAGIGALTGGAAAAFAAGSRTVAGMVGGMAGGALGGELGRKVYAGEVTKTAEAREDVASEARGTFSFSDFQTKRDAYQSTVKAANRAETKQRAAAVTGAIVGGMAAGRFAAEAVSDVWNSAMTDPIIQMKAVEVPRYAPNGERLTSLSVEGITLRGSNVTELSETDYPTTDVEMPRVMNEIKLHIKDLLEAHPNMNQGRLEEQVFAKLEARYGEQEWWQKADIKSLDIGTIRVEELPGEPTMSPEEQVMSKIGAVTPEPSASLVNSSPETSILFEHTVQSGETLTGIMKEEYAQLLKELPPAEQNRVLDTLFNKVRLDVDLRDSIGLRDGNIDRIYPGETLELDKLGAELKSIIEAGPERPRTGTLTFDASLQDDVETINIKEAVRSPIDEAYIDKGAINGYMEQTEFDRAKEVVKGGAVPLIKSNLEVYNPPQAPQEFLLSGKHFESPGYVRFLAENGFSPEQVKGATDKFALEFEGKTYGWLNELLQNFDSPYKELGNITIKEMDEMTKQAGDSEAALRNVLAEKAPDKTFNLPTIRTWSSLIDAMRQSDKIAFNENTPLSDLVQRYVAEQMIKNNYDAQFKATIK